MTPKDLEAFEGLIREKYPTTVITRTELVNGKIEYYGTIHDCKSQCRIDIPPEGWKPRYIRDPEYPRSIMVANGAKRYLRFHLPKMHEFDVSRITRHKCKGRPPGTRLTRIDEGEIHTYYDPNDLESKEFVSWVFNLTTRLCTNRFELFNLRTDESIEVLSGSHHWAGPDVLDRCQNERDFFVFIDADLETKDMIGWKALPRAKRKR